MAFGIALCLASLVSCLVTIHSIQSCLYVFACCLICQQTPEPVSGYVQRYSYCRVAGLIWSVHLNWDPTSTGSFFVLTAFSVHLTTLEFSVFQEPSPEVPSSILCPTKRKCDVVGLFAATRKRWEYHAPTGNFETVYSERFPGQFFFSLRAFSIIHHLKVYVTAVV